MGDVYNDPDCMGIHAFELNWLQLTLLHSARRSAETEFSIKLVHRSRGTLRVLGVSQF